MEEIKRLYQLELKVEQLEKQIKLLEERLRNHKHGVWRA